MTTQHEEQAVIVRAVLPSRDADEIYDDLSALEDQLAETIAVARVGEFDGNEIGQGELVLYMYGPDAEKLFSAVEPVLRDAQLMHEAIATIRRGPPGADSREARVGRTSEA